jgi:hypothetical protein
MASVLHRVTKEYLQSVNTPGYDPAEWLINPVLPDCPQRYWKIVGDTVVEMTQGEQDAIDAAITEAARQVALNQRVQQITDILQFYNTCRAVTKFWNLLGATGQANWTTYVDTTLPGYVSDGNPFAALPAPPAIPAALQPLARILRWD